MSSPRTASVGLPPSAASASIPGPDRLHAGSTCGIQRRDDGDHCAASSRNRRPGVALGRSTSTSATFDLRQPFARPPRCSPIKNLETILARIGMEATQIVTYTKAKGVETGGRSPLVDHKPGSSRRPRSASLPRAASSSSTLQAPTRTSYNQVVTIHQDDDDLRHRPILAGNYLVLDRRPRQLPATRSPQIYLSLARGA